MSIWSAGDGKGRREEPGCGRAVDGSLGFLQTWSLCFYYRICRGVAEEEEVVVAKKLTHRQRRKAGE
jgi:hypothetical protein